MTSNVIEAHNISLVIREPGVARAAVKLGGATVGGRMEEDGGARVVHALDNVSFSVAQKEIVAVIGRNGSGKTTMMRVAAGIYTPSSGRIVVNGRITTMFTNQIGVNQNASGLENIRLMGLLLGVPRSQMRALIEEVADFSELGPYLEMPLRSYSAGMRARLGFGLATSLNPEVLLIDEVFGTGDQEFRDKAKARLTALVRRAGAVLMASHSMEMLRQFCTKALWLDRGRVRMLGPVDEVRVEYAAEAKRVAAAAAAAAGAEVDAAAEAMAKA